MFFRFVSAIVLVVLIAMAGVEIEKRILDLRRDVSRQQYQTEILLDQHTALRLRTQELSAPRRMLQTLRDEQLAPRPVPPTERVPVLKEATPRERLGLPLMKWERRATPFRASDRRSR